MSISKCFHTCFHYIPLHYFRKMNETAHCCYLLLISQFSYLHPCFFCSSVTSRVLRILSLRLSRVAGLLYSWGCHFSLVSDVSNCLSVYLCICKMATALWMFGKPVVELDGKDVAPPVERSRRHEPIDAHALCVCDSSCF